MKDILILELKNGWLLKLDTEKAEFFERKIDLLYRLQNHIAREVRGEAKKLFSDVPVDA